MEQLNAFFTLIKTHWFYSILFFLSICIIINGLLKGLNFGMKIIYIILILGITGVVSFALLTLLP